MLNTLILTGVALLFAGGNIWYAAQRSTIPLSLNDLVDGVETRREKHPGKDDVYLLKLKGGQLLQVDQPIAEAVKAGQRIKKAAWSRKLDVESQVIVLDWSPDLRGMIGAMPAVLLVVLVTAVWVERVRDSGCQLESAGTEQVAAGSS